MITTHEVDDSEFEKWWTQFKSDEFRLAESGWTEKEIAKFSWTASRGMRDKAAEQAVLQSPEIQALRRENIRLLRLIKEMADHGTYETEYDGRMYSICHGCGAQDGENHRDPDCIYVRASAAMENQNEDS